MKSRTEYVREEWLEDIAAAAGYMRNETGIATVGALGLRLGATLAMQAAERHGVFDFAVLWEPVVRGTSYLKMNLQRSLIKAMMTEREQFAANSVMQRHAEEEVVDFDGYRVTQETREQIGAVDLLAHPPHFARPTLILNLGSREQASGEYRELAESMENAEARAAVQEPFWNRIGLVSAEAALEETALWLAELQAGALGQAGTRSADMQQ